MRRSQGRWFSEEEIKRIKSLLASTDMTLQEIATRMGCAKSSVVTINQTFQIRDYRGRRSCWVLNDSASPG
jgi:transcriptional regulator GlxA family with amidase domain